MTPDALWSEDRPVHEAEREVRITVSADPRGRAQTMIEGLDDGTVDLTGVAINLKRTLGSIATLKTGASVVIVLVGDQGERAASFLSAQGLVAPDRVTVTRMP